MILAAGEARKEAEKVWKAAEARAPGARRSRAFTPLQRSAIQTPQATSKTPATLPTNNPCGTTFSSSTNKAMMAIHQTFITPATNRSAMRNQQQPVQYAPCLRPMKNAPHFPSRQSVIKKLSGERQCVRQTFLSGVH